MQCSVTQAPLHDYCAGTYSSLAQAVHICLVEALKNIRSWGLQAPVTQSVFLLFTHSPHAWMSLQCTLAVKDRLSMHAQLHLMILIYPS